MSGDERTVLYRWQRAAAGTALILNNAASRIVSATTTYGHSMRHSHQPYNRPTNSLTKHSPAEVAIYLCIQRTVRRCWLCVVDALTGKSFEHRREWIQAKLEGLASLFGMDCLSFSVMSKRRPMNAS